MTEETLVRDYFPVHPLPNGLTVYVRKDEMGGDAPDQVVVAGPCRVTDTMYIVENVPLRALSRYLEGGVPIQDALPSLSPAQREFVKSGTSPGAFSTEY